MYDVASAWKKGRCVFMQKNSVAAARKWLVIIMPFLVLVSLVCRPPHWSVIADYHPKFHQSDKGFHILADN